jgi:hypothetical protein
MEFYNDGEVQRLYGLLCDNGYNKFEIHSYWPSSGIGQFIEVKLLDAN